MIIKDKIIKIPEKIEPARTIERKIYVAEDGTEFVNDWECLRYENEKSFRKLRSASCDSMLEIDEGEIKLLVVLNKEDDFNVVVNRYKQDHRLDRDCKYQGPGEYIVICCYRDTDEYTKPMMYIYPAEKVRSMLKETLLKINNFIDEGAE